MHAHLDPTSDLQGAARRCSKTFTEKSGSKTLRERGVWKTTCGRMFPGSYHSNARNKILLFTCILPSLCFSSIFWFLYVVTDWMALDEAEQATNKYRVVVVIMISGHQWVIRRMLDTVSKVIYLLRFSTLFTLHVNDLYAGSIFGLTASMVGIINWLSPPHGPLSSCVALLVLSLIPNHLPWIWAEVKNWNIMIVEGWKRIL